MPATWGYGTLLKMGDGASTEVFTTIASVESISGGGGTQAFDEITSHDSVGRYREYMPTLIEPGQVSFDIIWDPGDPTHEALQTAMDDGTLDNYQVVFPTNPAVTWEFAAYVASFTYTAEIDAALRGSVELRQTGAPTIT